MKSPIIALQRSFKFNRRLASTSIMLSSSFKSNAAKIAIRYIFLITNIGLLSNSLKNLRNQKTNMTKKKAIEKMGIVNNNLQDNLTSRTRTLLSNIIKNLPIIMTCSIEEEEDLKAPKIKKLLSKKHNNLNNHQQFSSKLQ